MPSATSPSNGGDTHRAVFGTSFATLRPLVLDEWPELTADDVDHTDGDAERLVMLVASVTGHTRALVRQQLVELGQCAAPRAAPASLEERLARVLDALEGGDTPRPDPRPRTRTRGMLGELRAEGQHLVEEVRESVSSTQDTLRQNFWTTLFATLGLGFIAGILVGHRRER
jgi:hypothetical protein